MSAQQRKSTEDYYATPDGLDWQAQSPDHSTNQVGGRRQALFAGSLLLSILLIFAWFWPLNFHVFMGDDLMWLRGDYNSAPSNAGFWTRAFTLENNIGKFRPVSNTLILASARLCRAGFDCYVVVNSAILALNALLLSFAAYKLSSSWWPTIFFPSIALIVSRFAYYDVLQVMGLMESISMTFVLSFAISAVQFLAFPRARWQAFMIASYGLALASHERFMVLIVPILLALLLRHRSLGRTRLTWSIGLALAITGLYLVLKQYVFHVSVFTGSGASMGASVLQTFSLQTFLFSIWQATINMFGFNAGPAAFSGKSFMDAGAPGIWLGILASATWIVLGISLFRQKSRHVTELRLDTPAFLVCTLSMLIISSSITPRQEYRWLFAPFAIFVLLTCFMLGELSQTRIKALLTLLVAVSFLSVDLYYRPFMDNLYFVGSSMIASRVKTGIVDRAVSLNLRDKELYIITHGNADIQRWILAGDYFFKQYATVPNITPHYIDTMNVLPINVSPSGNPVVFDIQWTTVRRIPDTQVSKLLLRKRQLTSSARTEYDFSGNFSPTLIIGPGLVNTNAERPRLILDWKDDTGSSYHAIALQNPFVVRFPAISCRPGSSLLFSAAIPDHSTTGGNLYIDVGVQGITQRLAAIAFEPKKNNATIDWRQYDIPVASCTGNTIDVMLGVEPLSGQKTTSLIALADLRLVTAK